MSSSDGANGGGRERGDSSSPPVVQTILESFTRCFHPDPSSVVGCGRIDPCSGGSREGSRPATPTGDDDMDTSAILSRAKLAAGSLVREGASTPVAGNTTVAETIRAKSMKRKLEIFRMDDAAARLQQQQQQGDASYQPAGCPLSDDGAPIRNAATNDLVLSDDEEELVQMSRKRFACGAIGFGGDGSCIQPSTPVGPPPPGAADDEDATAGTPDLPRPRNSWQWAGHILSGAQRGLCFATPVRTSSPEDVGRLPDDTLTDDEYAERYGGTEAVLAPPGALETSYNEDETIASTLYFDHRFSHLPQNRPPMPLFTEDKLSLSSKGGEGAPSDAITRMMRNRSLGDHRSFRETCSSPPRELDVRRRVPSSPTKLVRTPTKSKPTDVYDTPGTQPPSPGSAETPMSDASHTGWLSTPVGCAGALPSHPNASHAAAVVSPAGKLMPSSGGPIRLVPSKGRMATFPVPRVPGGSGGSERAEGVDDIVMDSSSLCEF